MPFKSNFKIVGLILSLSLAFCVCSLAVLAQPTLKGLSRKPPAKNDKEKPADDVIRIETNLVVSDVLVLNQKGNAILGLKKDDFIVTEDGKPQTVEMFSFGENADIPRSIVLIMDYSSSQTPYIKNSMEAAKLLVDKLAPQDRMAIVTDDVELLVDFTNDKVLLKNKLESLYLKSKARETGKSHQYSALYAVLNELIDDEDICPIVIFQTDGDELFSLLTSKSDEKSAKPKKSIKSDYFKRNYNFEDIKSIVVKSRATIYSIIPGFNFVGLSESERIAKMQIALDNNGDAWSAVIGLPLTKRNFTKDELVAMANTNLKQQLALLKIAKLSGGYTEFIEKLEDAKNVYSTIFKVISNRYIVYYYPADPTKDGKQRNVKIEIRGHPEYIVLGRKTYFIGQE